MENAILRVGYQQQYFLFSWSCLCFKKNNLRLHNLSLTFLVWQKVVHSPQNNRELANCG